MKKLSRVRNKRIKFISKEPKKDDDGYPIPGEENVFRGCWASIRGLRGKELYTAASVQAQKDKIFNCKYFFGLTEKMLIKYNKEYYNIKSINDLNEKHEEYEICARVLSTSG